LIRQLEEKPEPGDHEAVAEGRREFERGDFVTLDQLRHDIGLGDG
jgi:PHD/YefM family antitoxin component YafN of YafNO toxin-antitoxin module